ALADIGTGSISSFQPFPSLPSDISSLKAGQLSDKAAVAEAQKVIAQAKTATTNAGRIGGSTLVAGPAHLQPLVTGQTGIALGARVTVVVNPRSGGGRAARGLPEVEHRLAALGADVLVSDGPEHAGVIARDAAAAGADVVAAMGGDGMVGTVGAALIGTAAAL